MTGSLRIVRAGPLASLQDEGRFGALVHGISASGAMDRSAYRLTGSMLPNPGRTAVEFTTAGLEFVVDNVSTEAGFSGGDFKLRINGKVLPWGSTVSLKPGDRVAITPGSAGNYGYVRFGHEIDVPLVMGSTSTNSRAGLGGIEGRALRAGDVLPLRDVDLKTARSAIAETAQGPIRIMWGLHAEHFDATTRENFLLKDFTVSTRFDRMGVRLTDETGVFKQNQGLSLVSDAIVAGDIQILGDGAPIVLMRDHQPTGGYPRIATVISADMDRFAQLRPGTKVRFASVTLTHAHRLRSR